jgi:hypothetical protein
MFGSHFQGEGPFAPEGNLLPRVHGSQFISQALDCIALTVNRYCNVSAVHLGFYCSAKSTDARKNLCLGQYDIPFFDEIAV